MTRNIKTTTIDKSLYINYFKKATEFKESMNEAIFARNWNAASLNAIHVGISSNDAVLVCYYGIRSISSKHDDSVKLLRSLMKDEKADLAANHLVKLIYAKNMIEYEARLFKQDEAHTLVKHADKFYSWVRSVLPD